MFKYINCNGKFQLAYYKKNKLITKDINLISSFLRIERSVFYDYLKDYGAIKDMLGNIYFYDKTKIMELIKQLNVL